MTRRAGGPLEAVPSARVELLRGALNVLTPHGVHDYPGLRVVQPEGWRARAIVLQDGQTIVALGGETLYGYELAGGGRAEGFTLAPGDRATRTRSGLEHSLAEWRIERAAR